MAVRSITIWQDEGEGWVPVTGWFDENEFDGPALGPAEEFEWEGRPVRAFPFGNQEGRELLVEDSVLEAELGWLRGDSVVHFDAYDVPHGDAPVTSRDAATSRLSLDHFRSIAPPSESVTVELGGECVAMRPAVSGWGRPLMIREDQAAWLLGGGSERGFGIWG